MIDLGQYVTDEVLLAAIRGWNGLASDTDLSRVQTSPETMEAWRRAIIAAFTAITFGHGPVRR